MATQNDNETRQDALQLAKDLRKAAQPDRNSPPQEELQIVTAIIYASTIISKQIEQLNLSIERLTQTIAMQYSISQLAQTLNDKPSLKLHDNDHSIGNSIYDDDSNINDDEFI